MKLDVDTFIGIDGKPYIHIYKKGVHAFTSIRVTLHDDGDISASHSSKKTWREWAKDDP